MRVPDLAWGAYIDRRENVIAFAFVPLSKTGAELLFNVFSQRYENGSTMVTSTLPFDEWTKVFGSERLTGVLPNRLTHGLTMAYARANVEAPKSLIERLIGQIGPLRESRRLRQAFEKQMGSAEAEA